MDEELAEQWRDILARVVTIILYRGQVLLFDSNLLHAGAAGTDLLDPRLFFFFQPKEGLPHKTDAKATYSVEFMFPGLCTDKIFSCIPGVNTIDEEPPTHADDPVPEYTPPAETLLAAATLRHKEARAALTRIRAE